MRLLAADLEVDDVDAFLAALNDVADGHGCTVQAFDARYVVGRGHLERAVELADRAVERGANVARDRAVEILLYAAGRRQIDQALEMGVGEGRTPVVVLVDGEGEAAAAAALAAGLDGADGVEWAGGVERADDPADYDEARVREFFDVSDAELAAVEGALADVVRERVALLDVEK